jgi:hypothetical protein
VERAELAATRQEARVMADELRRPPRLRTKEDILKRRPITPERRARIDELKHQMEQVRSDAERPREADDDEEQT